MAITLDGTTGITTPSLTNTGAEAVTGNLTVNGNTTLGDASTDTILMTGAPSIGGAGYGMGFGFRNRIINGAMVIDQRNAGASVTPSAGTYTLDRYAFTVTAASKLTCQQNAGSITPPVGFKNYLGITSSSAYSIGSGDLFQVYQAIEGLNIYDLAWGTANATTVTLSFWVRSSLTGTFGGAIQNSAQNRSYPYSYTILAANTWEQKSITIAGDTTGTWLTTNGVGMYVGFGLGAGSTYSGTAGAWAGANYNSATGATSVVGTNGATFYITGVQLEKGSTATSFDYRPYGTELALCQRYYQRVGAFARQTGAAINTTGVIVPVPTPVTFRATPSFSGSISQMKSYSGGAVSIASITYAVNDSFDSQVDIRFNGLSVSDNNNYWVSFNASSLSAEL